MHRTPLQPALGKRLLALRLAADKTLLEAAYESGSTPQAISMWERGERMPSFERVARLAAVYGVTTNDLLVEEAS